MANNSMENMQDNEFTEFNSYLTLIITKPYSDIITRLRLKYDFFTAGLPTEITVLGSSGVGPIAPRQKKETVINEIEKVIPQIKAFEFNFARMNQFPQTAIFYLEPEQRKSFDQIHSIVRTIKVDILQNKFPYNPHCTIHSAGNISIDNKEILNENIDKSIIMIDEISWIEYNYNPFSCKILKSWKI